MYTPNHDPLGKFSGVKLADGTTIPNDPANADWQRFLTWQNDLANKYPIDMRDKAIAVNTLPELTVADLTEAERKILLDIALDGYLKSHPTVIEVIRKK